MNFETTTGTFQLCLPGRGLMDKLLNLKKIWKSFQYKHAIFTIYVFWLCEERSFGRIVFAMGILTPGKTVYIFKRGTAVENIPRDIPALLLI